MKRKNLRAGASIALALFYLLVCSTICVILITAGSVVSGINKDVENDNKEKLMCISCLIDFSKELSGKKIEIRKDNSLLENSSRLNSIGLRLTHEYITRALIEQEPYKKDFVINIDDGTCKAYGTFAAVNKNITIAINKIERGSRKYYLSCYNALSFDCILKEESREEIFYTYGECKWIN